MTGAFAELPESAGQLIRDVVGRREPTLATRLSTTVDLPYEDRSAVEHHLANELAPEIQGPDWEPTDYGRAIERAIDRFIYRYPIQQPD